MQPSPFYSDARSTLVAGARGSGKTSWIIAHARTLLDDGAPARRILIVTFSPRVAARIAAHLPAEVDADATGGVWLQTAQGLCGRLLHNCQRAAGRPNDPRIISAFERATLLQAAAEEVAAELGPGHPLAPALADSGGLAEIDLLLDAVAAQGSTPNELEEISAGLPTPAHALDRAVLDGVGRVYRAHRTLCERVSALTYQDVAARAAAMLADPALAAPIAERVDHLLIDDLDRAEPAQVRVLARIAAHARITATVDPDGVISDRAVRAVALARELLGLDVSHPSRTLPPAFAGPALARMWTRLQLRREAAQGATGVSDVGDDDARDCLPTHVGSPMAINGQCDASRTSANLPSEPALADYRCHGVASFTRPQSAYPAMRPQSQVESDPGRHGSEGSLVVAEELLDTAEAAYVARVTRAALDEAVEPEPHAEPDVLILPPIPSMRTLILAALHEEGVAAVNIAGHEGSTTPYDPAVRYVLAWLRVLVDPDDGAWERVLASPHARIPVADVARLRHWAEEKSLLLHRAVLEAADGACEALSDASRTRLSDLARLHAELRASATAGEAPGVTLHRLLAREDLVGALLVGPTDTGAVPPDPHGLAGLCELVDRVEELWRRAYGKPPHPAALIGRLEQGLAHLQRRAAAPPAGRVVLADPEGVADWRARVVIIPGLAEQLVPRPRARSWLLSDAALAHLRSRWALPWPADVAAHAREERRTLALAVAAARERVVLTRALRYEGEEATVPSPLLRDALGAARVDAAACRAAGARFHQWSVTHEEIPDRAIPTADGDPARVKRAGDLLAQAPREAARHLDTLLYRHARLLATFDEGAAARFIAGARAILADADAPARGRYLALSDPFATLPAASTMLQSGARISTYSLNDFLYCPRRFFYSTLAAIRPAMNARMAFGMLLGKAVQALLRLHPTALAWELGEAVAVEEAEEVLRLLWHGEELPGAEPDDEVEPFAGRFGARLEAEATRALARSALRRLAGAEGRSRHPSRTCAVGVRVELPIELPDGRTVRVTATVDRIAAPPEGAAGGMLTLIDYRSGASDPTPYGLIEEFLNRKGSPTWQPRDYTLPVMFLGVAGNRDVYAQHNLPLLPVRRLATVSLGKGSDGYPLSCTVEIGEQRAGRNTVTTAELEAVREQIAAAVTAAAQGPHQPTPRNTYNPCRGCAHRFACAGPETVE